RLLNDGLGAVDLAEEVDGQLPARSEARVRREPTVVEAGDGHVRVRCLTPGHTDHDDLAVRLLEHRAGEVGLGGEAEDGLCHPRRWHTAGGNVLEPEAGSSAGIDANGGEDRSIRQDDDVHGLVVSTERCPDGPTAHEAEAIVAGPWKLALAIAEVAHEPGVGSI